MVEPPKKLNRFHQDGVRIFAKLLTALPAQNVKALPALNMLLNNPSACNKKIVEASSGSTVTSLGITIRVLYDNYDTTAYCTNKTEIKRLRQLQFFGLKVELYGGPAQPEFTDPRGIIEWVRNLERNNEDILNPAQYNNENNWKPHLRWTGPQLWKQLPEIDIFCMGMGSSGCVTGTGRYLKSKKPSVKVLGVCNAERDPAPGPRAYPLFESCPFPWKDVVDFVESVGSVDSYRLSMRLSREGIIAGPSSGMALQGLYNFLQTEKIKDCLGSYRDRLTEENCCVFACCDLPHQYLDGYFTKLGPKAFQPIINEDLLSIDQELYDLKWEIDYTQCCRSIPDEVASLKDSHLCTDKSCEAQGRCISSRSDSDILFFDLRSAPDFIEYHVAGAVNSPLQGLSKHNTSPFDFDDTSELKRQWSILQTKLADEESAHLEESTAVIVLDYNGDTSRVATAIMRSKGQSAFSFLHGMPGVQLFLSRREGTENSYQTKSDGSV